MKKLVLIVSLIFVAASCQKENIVPNAPMAQRGTEKSGTATDPNSPVTHGGGVVTLPSTDAPTTTTTDPSTPGDDGAITDPMKKKDKKDSK